MNKPKLPETVLILGFIALCGIGLYNEQCRVGRPIPAEPVSEQAESVEMPMHVFGTDPRSSKWAKVRDDFIKLNPRCAACGTTENLNVHHIVPFHDDESKELDPNNLITLCREHHFGVGHERNWQKSNPNVKIDSERIRKSSAK